jgi:hypothetical protein
MSLYDELIDVAGGTISREIFIDDRIYAQEPEKIIRPAVAVRRP